MASRLRRIALDITPLRVSPPFRRLWIGLLVTASGSQFTRVAVFVQLTALTGSEIAVGASGIAYLAGLLAGTVGFATIIDAWDRRRLLIMAQLGAMSGVGILLVASMLDEPPIALVYLGIAVVAAVSALDSPTRSAMTPRLLGTELIPSAQALNQVVWNGAGLLGPAVAGVVIGATGLTVAYAIDLLSLVGMLVAAWSLDPMAPLDTERNATGAAAIREGFSYVRHHELIRSTFVIDLVAMIFGMPRAL
ncbi:MAG TPA: MFS transporter, partial [Actinomycetota bacterium]